MGTTAEELRSMHSHETGHRLTADEVAFLKEFFLIRRNSSLLAMRERNPRSILSRKE